MCRGVLVTRTTGVGLAAVPPLLVLCAVLAPELDTSSQSTLLAVTATAPAPDQLDLSVGPPERLSDDEDRVRDLYGNDIASAVAKYTFDATGSLYEIHSPHTELPRLGPPKS